MENINNWTDFLPILGYLGILISVIIVVAYFAKLSAQKDAPKKYSFINASEIKSFERAGIIFAIGLGVLLFSFIVNRAEVNEVHEFLFAIIVSGAAGTGVGYAINAYLEYYYPFIIEKKLNKIRFKKRLSPSSGKPMRLLNEMEEDEYMAQEMIDEELKYAVDYDVWLDEDTGHKIIEKYDIHLHALICDVCNFRTLKEVSEEVVESPQLNKSGLMRKMYRCTYCGNRDEKNVKIAPINEEEKVNEMT